MNRFILSTLLTGALCAASGGANAADWGIYGEAGTLGGGGGLAVQLSDRFSVRAGYSGFSHDVEDYQAQDLTIDAQGKISAGKVLLDWHPFGGGFRLGIGAVHNGSEANGVARPSGGGYTINGTFYPRSEIASAEGRVDFDSVAPYIGLGFGRTLDRTGRFNLLLDIGVAFTGAADIAVDVTCGSVPAPVCAQIREDVAAEQARIEEDLEDLELWPHLNLALSWRF